MRQAVAGRGIARRLGLTVDSSVRGLAAASSPSTGMRQAVKGAGIARRLLLPSESAVQGVSGQGWTVNTVVKQSLIPGAGNGRFTAEPVKVHTPISMKPMIEMAKIDNLAGLPADRVVTFSSVADLEKYVTLAIEEGGFSREQVLDCFANFIWSFDGRRACLNHSTWSVNHGDTIAGGLNLEFGEKTMADGSTVMVGEAMVDMGVDVEIRNDYKAFWQPDFYLQYCHDHNFQDVRSIVMDAIGAPQQAFSPA